MGSIITLSLGRLEVDWGKNGIGRDHSLLFFPQDVKDVTYFYADNFKEKKPGYARLLGSIKMRLELLGYTLSSCKLMYEYGLEVSEYVDFPKIPFEGFARALTNVDVDKVRLPDDPEWYDFGEWVVKNILEDYEFIKSNPEFGKLTKNDGFFFENIDPYVILRLLAENENNVNKEVVWRFSDVLEGGWVDKDSVYQGLQDQDRYLIVTEGSSDSAILKKSAELVIPDVADFFYFIDMSENYPFTGTGNLYRFCQGLARIKIQNRILVVFDNDTAGHEAYKKVRKVELPPNMHVALLPNLDECRPFNTVGPTGNSEEDINGRAVSIEMFLDLNHGAKRKPAVRWTSYNENLNCYQGELIDKEYYVRSFLKRKRFSGYDMSKLVLLWHHLMGCCIADGASHIASAAASHH